jgi:hypothetical protein
MYFGNDYAEMIPNETKYFVFKIFENKLFLPRRMHDW